jgi:hypothetical protein|tara:strand:- start:47 stop:259 length:213 start_codon:yes stop_codon:yes gene_type:complete
MLKNTEKYERKTPQGSTAITQAMNEDAASREDALVASTKSIYKKVEPSNDNSQLNRLLYPPYTDKSKRDA